MKLAADVGAQLRAVMINNPADMCSARGTPRHSALSGTSGPLPLTDSYPGQRGCNRRIPGFLQMEIRRVNEPASNVVDIRSRNVVLQRPGWPPHDWASDPDVNPPPV
jgi:hypothetical protein